MSDDHCPDCGYHREIGCAFICTVHLPPAKRDDAGGWRLDRDAYQPWADVQKEQYRRLGEKFAGEERERLAQEAKALRDAKKP